MGPATCGGHGQRGDECYQQGSFRKPIQVEPKIEGKVDGNKCPELSKIRGIPKLT